MASFDTSSGKHVLKAEPTVRRLAHYFMWILNTHPASMTITQYLGMGTTSRGRMGITPSLNTRVMTSPYLRNQYDKEAVVQGIEYIRGVLSQIQNLTWVVPKVNQTTTAFVNSVSQNAVRHGDDASRQY
jgi:hypothetical protein